MYDPSILVEAQDLASHTCPQAHLTRELRVFYRRGLQGLPMPLVHSRDEKVAYLAGVARQGLDLDKINPALLGLNLESGCRLAF